MHYALLALFILFVFSVPSLNWNVDVEAYEKVERGKDDKSRYVRIHYAFVFLLCVLSVPISKDV